MRTTSPSLNRAALLSRGLPLCLVVALAGCWDFDALVPATSTDLTSPPEVMDLSTPDLQCQRNPLKEDCSNGVDDNGDCRVDCEDEDCKRDAACKIASLGLLTTSAGATAPACAAGQTASGAVLYQGIAVPNPACTGCDCNNPTCSVPKVSAFPNNQCAAGMGTQVAQNLATGACVATSPAPAAGSFFYVDAPRQACTPKAAAGTVAPAYQQRAQLCQPGGVMTCPYLDCVTPPAGMKLCLAFDREPKYCPPPFSQRVTSWQGKYNDARTCACACTPPAAECTMGVVTAYGVAGCGTAANLPAVDLLAACAAGPTNTMTMMATAALSLKSSYTPVAGAKCAAAGTVSGAAPTLSNPAVLCCQP